MANGAARKLVRNGLTLMFLGRDELSNRGQRLRFRSDAAASSSQRGVFVHAINQ